MKRGDLVTVALQGDYGKPRPALIVQSDAFSDLDSVIVAPLTSSNSTTDHVPLLRIRLEPDASNKLRSSSAIMIDKLTVVARSRVGPQFGSVDPSVLNSVAEAMRGLLDL
jgi:mRNA interferase MazF